MKISNASKKVLASALSAAMVVAFAPAAAFGAGVGGKVTVDYNAGAGSAITGGQGGVVNSKTYTVSNAGALGLESGSDLMIKSGKTDTDADDGYAFKAWDVWADTNADGVRAEDNSENLTVNTANNTVDVSSGAIDSATKIYATAKYNAPSIAQKTVTSAPSAGGATTTTAVDYVSFANVDGVDKVKLTAAVADSDLAKGVTKFVVTAPGKDAVEKSALDDTAFDAVTGAWKVELKDGNGVVVDTKTFYIGSLTLTGAAFGDPSSTTDQMATAKTIWYQAGAEKTYASVIGSTTAHKVKDGELVKDSSGSYIAATNWYDAAGNDQNAVKTIGKNEKGAVNTVLTASFGEVALVTFKNDKGTISAVAEGIVATGASANVATAEQATKYETTVFAGAKYYMAITDTAGKVVAESVDTNAEDDTDTAAGWTGGTGTLTATVEPGTYTATLYKVTGKTNATATVDATPGKIEAVGSKTVTVDAYKAAVPTWSFEAKYKADGSYDGGVLTLANAAGEGYTVQYKTAGTYTDYNTALGGIVLSASASSDYTIQSNNKKTSDDNVTSKEVVLFSGATQLNAFYTAVTASTMKTKRVNGKVGAYYVNDEGVKAAVKAAEKTFTDKGFVEKTKDAGTAPKAWAPVTVAAEQSFVDAVANVAKAELAKYAAGVASADGKTVSVLAPADYDAAVKAVEAVSAAYAANHDGDAKNNVSKVNDTAVSGLESYVDAVDAGLKAGVKKAESFKAEDVKAAADVTAALKAAKTGDEAKAAIEAYGKLSNEAKKLVAAADIAAAQDVVTKAELAEAQDEAAIAKVKGKTVKAKAKKATKSSLKVVTSKSGAKSTFKKTSGNSKVKVYKSGKIVVKKGLKAGKKYTVKVKATVGASTKTVKVVVKVAK